MTTYINVKGDEHDVVNLGFNSNGYYDASAARSWSKSESGVEVDGTIYDVWSIGGRSYRGSAEIYIEQGIQVI